VSIGSALKEDKIRSTEIVSSTDVLSVIEALLFVSNSPVSIDRLVQVIDGVDRATVCQLVEELRVRFNSNNGGAVVLREIAGGFQLCTHPKYSPWIKKLSSVRADSKLSRAALETLAIVAYKQPATRTEIEAVRGVSCAGVLALLLEKRLVRVAGRQDVPGKPLLYRTTQDFLHHFGLRSLKDLPRITELKELC
jgi:segregation and condensation protein B